MTREALIALDPALAKFMSPQRPDRVVSEVAVHFCEFQPPHGVWGWTIHRNDWVRFARTSSGQIQMKVPENAPSTPIGGASFGIILFEGSDIEKLRKMIEESQNIRALSEGHK